MPLVKTRPTTKAVWVSTHSWLRRNRVGLVIRCQHDYAAALHLFRKITAVHDVCIMAIDLDSRIAVKQHIRERVYLALPYIAAATGVADDIFRLQDIVVEESEPTDACHSELQGNLASPDPHPATRTCASLSRPTSNRGAMRAKSLASSLIGYSLFLGPLARLTPSIMVAEPSLSQLQRGKNGVLPGFHPLMTPYRQSAPSFHLWGEFSLMEFA